MQLASNRSFNFEIWKQSNVFSQTRCFLLISIFVFVVSLCFYIWQVAGASGIIRSVAVGEVLRVAAQEARNAVQEDLGFATLGAGNASESRQNVIVYSSDSSGSSDSSDSRLL